jgi:hypothetical protein
VETLIWRYRGRRTPAPMFALGFAGYSMRMASTHLQGCRMKGDPKGGTVAAELGSKGASSIGPGMGLGKSGA